MAVGWPRIALMPLQLRHYQPNCQTDPQRKCKAQNRGNPQEWESLPTLQRQSEDIAHVTNEVMRLFQVCFRMFSKNSSQNSIW